jgi:hypothetical protein
VSTRLLHKTSGRSRNEAREVLEFFFLAELISPSRSLWIVSPWMRDVTLFDNRAGAFATLFPDLPRRELRLTDALRELMARGTRIILVTRPPPDDGDVGRLMEESAAANGRRGQLAVHHRSESHTKGIVGDGAAIVGSMNFTHNGLDVQMEYVQLTTDGEPLSKLQLEFASTYGR